MALSIIPQLIIILFLTALNAFFAAAEMAVVSVNKMAVKALAEKGNKEAAQLVTIIQQPNKFLATIQVGITLAGFFSSASAATGLAKGLGTYLMGLGVPFGSLIAVVVVTVILSYFILVFGELLPKRLALGNALNVALFSVGPLNIIGKITAPFVWILTRSISGIMKLFHIKQKESEDKMTEEKIRLLVKKGAMDGGIRKVEAQRIHCIFEFDNQLAKEVMIPIKKVFMIDIDDDLDVILKQLALEKHSRTPVYQNNVNNVIGIILLKDVFELIQQDNVTKADLKQLLYSPIIVSENVILDQLFVQLQKSKKHMAIVKNENNTLKGIITIEDMIEEIFGEIDDEFDV
jgi:putative hemolysin